MTEEEARTKVCPRYMTAIFNEGWWEHSVGYCLGSDCMMWQATDNEPRYPMRNADDLVEKWEFLPAGYCGLIK